MQPQENFNESGSNEQDSLVCGQCGAPMPREMRFCRSCGNRLGEGPAEYTETVRFQGATAKGSTATTPFYPSVNAPMIRRGFGSRRKRWGFSGMTWMWIGLGLFFALGGGMSALLKAPHSMRMSRPAIAISSNRAWVGVKSFQTTDGGVTFDKVDPPDGPADKAGLVGGDIVTSFDGHVVKEDDEIMDLLGETPVGKKVEVIYLRDGISHNAQLTTISREDINRLGDEFGSRPQGKFGFESNRMTRIANPETKTFGVQIDWVETNGPADLFGIKVGDIITDFDNVPIRTPEEFLSRVRRTMPRTQVNVGVLREGKRLVIPVTLGKG
jgi:PDZ domain